MGQVGQIIRESIASQIKEGVGNHQVTFVVNFSSVKGTQMDALRQNMRDLGVGVQVTKKRIARLTLKEMEMESLADVIGPEQTAFAWSSADSVSVAKALTDFAKDCEGFDIQGAVLDGTVLAQEEIKRLADLPAKEVLQAQLMGTILAPLTRLAGALNAKSRDLLSILKQLSEQKGGS
ncbi:MAG: 50S ribosomal protein L10 [Candidatus Omnitrophota bacterium]